ncbi:MAG: conjugative transposon protein TraM [Bacteroidota bacterium]
MKPKIKFSQPKYVLPIIALPFLCLIFYVFSSWGKDKKQTPEEIAAAKQKIDQINPSIQDPSKDVRSADMKDKFEAYSDRFGKDQDYSAVQSLDPKDPNDQNGIKSQYSSKEQRQLDSIAQSIKDRQAANAAGKLKGPGGYMPSATSNSRGAISETDKKLAEAMGELNNRHRAADQRAAPSREDDYSKQMKMFKQQMEYMDSLEKSRDPEFKAAQKKKARQQKDLDSTKAKPLHVGKADGINTSVFNTIKAQKTDLFIKAIIDENIKGYAGSRIRIRLLDDIQVGENLLTKGTYLYGLINGFQSQRVLITITSVMIGDNLLPVNLKVYDNDGLEGLYVPSSQFREFTKDLGSSGAQGIQYTDDGSGSNQIMTGLVTKLFTSTTTAAAELIKKDKAKLKYNTIVYLVSKEEK